ncbi:DUF2971 domain-containing protein [Rhodobacteraceae bacterium DSL-40]|uniref:DUF2971 domain-containing protein n=1 Tax=Amaricoccus sp. B4 TaxID=3368557 RepID=UPI000DAD7BD8
MFFSDEEINLLRLFDPWYLSQVKRMYNEKKRLVHYTSSSVAFSILKNSEIWMRNAACMNDYMEIYHGIQFVDKFITSELYISVMRLIDESFPDTSKYIEAIFHNYKNQYLYDTYITCLSEHETSEDFLGRLSMWRAYGGKSGVALVVRNTPFLTYKNQNIGAFSAPVLYAGEKNFKSHLEETFENLRNSIEEISKLDKEDVKKMLANLLIRLILCSKHPGFSEEKEWRIYHLPIFFQSKHLSKSIEICRGDPQIVYKMPLKNRSDLEIRNIDPKEILDSLVIGPHENPLPLSRAFKYILEDLKFSNPDKIIKVSDIPLR